MNEHRSGSLKSFVVAGSLVFTWDGEIVDFSEPANPEVVGQFDARYGFNVSDRYLYTSESDTVRILDISDVRNPTEVSKVYDRCIMCADILISDSLMYLIAVFGDVQIFDISDPTDPLEIGYSRVCPRYDFPLEAKIQGNYLFDSYEITITDISDPRNPVENAGYYVNEDRRHSYGGVAIGDNGLIYATNNISFDIFRFTPPEAEVAQDNDMLPTSFSLSTAYPNPFNSTTTIGYSLPMTGMVSLTVFDLSSREVARLVEGVMTAGTHEAVWVANSMASGVYVVKLVAGEKTKMNKVVLVR